MLTVRRSRRNIESPALLGIIDLFIMPTPRKTGEKPL